MSNTDTALVVRDDSAYSFLSSQPLSPLTTGCLPPSQPIVARGDVYCGNDFRRRAVAWFVSECERNAAQQNGLESGSERKLLMPPGAAKAAAKTTTKKARPSSAPTRVQPPRAAKKRTASEAEVDAASVRSAKKTKTAETPLPLQLQLHRPQPAEVVRCDYSLDPAYAARAVAPQFQDIVDTVLESRRASLTSGCYWSTVLMPTGPKAAAAAALQSMWCPIVARPLACTDMAYCQHGIGRNSSAFGSSSTSSSTSTSMISSTSSSSRFVTVPTPAPEADMAPLTPPPEVVLRTHAKAHAEWRHIQERIVEVAGLRFAVDVCNGALRVCML